MKHRGMCETFAGAWVLLASVVGVLGAPSVAVAQDKGTEPSYSSVVVQEREFEPTHEFTVSVGTLPLDAFRKGVTVSGAYTLHFTNKVAWEIVQGSYSFPVDTPLNSRLEELNLRPTPFEVVEFFVTSNAIFKPVYWKGSVLNGRLLYGELFLNAGAGYGWFTRSSRPAIDLGGGIKLFASQLLSFKLNLRYMLFPALSADNFDVRQELWLGLGTSLTF